LAIFKVLIFDCGFSCLKIPEAQNPL